MITVYFIWGWKENNLRMFTSVHYIWGRLWTSNHTRTQTFSISFRQRTFIFVLFRDIVRSPPWIKLIFFSLVFFFISLTVVKLVIMIKIFTSRFKSMFPWLLVMPWCRSKILDQSLSRHHACLVGTGHNKGKEKKKPFSLGNEKKNLRGKSFFIADGNIAQLFFTQEISLPSKKSYSFLYLRFCFLFL